MASHAISLYNSSTTPYNLDGALFFTMEDLEKETPVSMAPLAVLPPLSGGSSKGDSLKSTACSRPPLSGGKIKKATTRRPTTGALGVKNTNSNIGKRPMAARSGSTSCYHTTSDVPSHILVGVDRSNGGRGKGFIRNPDKVPASKSIGTSSGALLRIPRRNAKKAPNVVESESVRAEPRVPTLSFL